MCKLWQAFKARWLTDKNSDWVIGYDA